MVTTGDPEKTVRVFFALWPGARERTTLAAWQPVLHELCGGKAVAEENLHATLVFLGDVVLHRLEALALAAQEVRGHKFDLTFDLARYWGHNHIVHAAPTYVPPHLSGLVSDLERNLSRHRFHFDGHPEYKPHVTLLRHSRWRDASLPQMRPSRWHVASFALVQSVSGSQGVSYQVVAQFPLR